MLTLAASDDPTYTLQFVGVDLTGLLEEGQPVCWTQDGIVRYGWISSVPSYTAGNTTITILTRLDDISSNYDVLDTSSYPITGFCHGLKRQPGFGMPIDEAAWTLVVSSTSNMYKNSPTNSVWYHSYDSGDLPSLVVPIGLFDLAWFADMFATSDNTSPHASVYVTLSTTTNSETDGDFTNRAFASADHDLQGTLFALIDTGRSKQVHLTSKTNFYLNYKTDHNSIQLALGGTQTPTVIKAKCAYL